MKNKKIINITFIFLILITLLIGGGLGTTYLINKNYDISTIITQNHIGDITISNTMTEPYEWQLRDQINKYNRLANNNFKILSVDKSTMEGYNEMVIIGSYKLFNKSQKIIYFNMYQEKPISFTEEPDDLTDIDKPTSLITDTMIIGLWCAKYNFNPYDFIGLRLIKNNDKDYALFFTSYVPWVTINIPDSSNPYAILINIFFK